ncbi:MAG TPA: DUF167 domain-containing protein [Nevskia sp.]|jgi:hypothetical protein|nr:DUF167 domain-containing protein [Nevskia sp.]
MALLQLKVSPGASRNAVLGFLGETLKLAVTAAPERGKANEAVEALLAEALDLPKGAVRVVAGHAARSKRVEIAGLEAAEIVRRLRTILERSS